MAILHTVAALELVLGTDRFSNRVARKRSAETVGCAIAEVADYRQGGWFGQFGGDGDSQWKEQG
jgi:hypothetical protein